MRPYAGPHNVHQDLDVYKRQGYKACASLKKLGDRYGRKRLENACGRVLAFTTTPSVRNISSLLKNERDVYKRQLPSFDLKGVPSGSRRLI